MKLTEVTLNEEIDAGSAWQLLQDVAETIDEKINFSSSYGDQIIFDGTEVMHNVLQVVRFYELTPDGQFERENVKRGLKIETELHALGKRMYNSSEQLREVSFGINDALETGWKPSPSTMAVLDAIQKLEMENARLARNLTALVRVVNFIDNTLVMKLRDPKTDEFHRAIIRAAFKKLGVMKK